jgi:hypothetical protein
MTNVIHCATSKASKQASSMLGTEAWKVMKSLHPASLHCNMSLLNAPVQKKTNVKLGLGG